MLTASPAHRRRRRLRDRRRAGTVTPTTPTTLSRTHDVRGLHIKIILSTILYTRDIKAIVNKIGLISK